MTVVPGSCLIGYSIGVFFWASHHWYFFLLNFLFIILHCDCHVRRYKRIYIYQCLTNIYSDDPKSMGIILLWYVRNGYINTMECETSYINLCLHLCGTTIWRADLTPVHWSLKFLVCDQVLEINTSYSPLFKGKSGVCRGLHFSYFCSEQIFWYCYTASMRHFWRTRKNMFGIYYTIFHLNMNFIRVLKDNIIYRYVILYVVWTVS